MNQNEDLERINFQGPLPLLPLFLSAFSLGMGEEGEEKLKPASTERNTGNS